MNDHIWLDIVDYFQNNAGHYLSLVGEHLRISLLALAAAAVIGIPLGYFAERYHTAERLVMSVFQSLRIIPSLAVLVVLIPIMGTGTKPALCALILLAVPPILMNTAAGLHEVPGAMLEAAYGAGMTDWQVLWKVKLPLSAPLVLTGVKTAMIEVIASATLASKIGAGGLGDIIFTGLGLNRIDLLVIGGGSVAVLSIVCGLLLDLTDRLWLRYKYAGR